MFLVVLQEAAELFDCQVAAYCLMPNHYHLLVQTPQGNLSRVMRHVNSVYTQRFNRRRKTDGQLFRGRYKSILVEEDSYLLELLRYIHRNPVRAGLSKTMAKYQWSSHKGYVSTAGKWDWLYREFLLGMFSDNPDSAIKSYRQFVQREDSPEILDFFSSKRPASLLGSEDFVEWVKVKFHELKRDGEVPDSRRLAPAIADIRRAVSESWGVDPEMLDTAKRGQLNEPRNMAIYLARKLSGLGLNEIAKEFGLGSYTSVSSLVIRTEERLSQSKKLQKRLEEVKSKINKRQRKT